MPMNTITDTHASTSAPYEAPSAPLRGADEAAPLPWLLSPAGRLTRWQYVSNVFAVALVTWFGAPMLIMLIANVLSAPELALAVVGSGAAVLVAYAWLVFSIKRAHDIGHSGWAALIIVVPFAWLYLAFAPGRAEANRFGVAPPNRVSHKIGAILFSAVFAMLLISTKVAISA